MRAIVINSRNRTVAGVESQYMAAKTTEEATP